MTVTPDTVAELSLLPPFEIIEALLSYMLSVHRCTDGPVIHAFGASEGTIGIAGVPVD